MGFQSLSIVDPSHMATNRDKSVCFVIRANEMATKGGNKHSIPNFVSIRKSPPVFNTVVYRGNKERWIGNGVMAVMKLLNGFVATVFLLFTPSFYVCEVSLHMRSLLRLTAAWRLAYEV